MIILEKHFKTFCVMQGAAIVLYLYSDRFSSHFTAIVLLVMALHIDWEICCCIEVTWGECRPQQDYTSHNSFQLLDSVCSFLLKCTLGSCRCRYRYDEPISTPVSMELARALPQKAGLWSFLLLLILALIYYGGLRCLCVKLWLFPNSNKK